ncbi:DUF6179 domain-containing protein [Eubacterium barkeri]|uniref:Uncharacterized protein n=1 Tax=Eubacterium barkeri TaxID=1528 RepID=A0A1H3BMP3_EUBBA|nr:DUF6179 domain-containing protein [Eubacterium barkeri]SDX43252.1 hypothetical protein SAMN04488579_102142 [Eubacterium barkeri]
MNPESLIPIVSSLANRYTKGRSTSLSYEMANQLMEAVLYCIKAYQGHGDPSFPTPILDPALAYERGYALILSKTHQCKRLYEKLLIIFDDFRCLNCGSTVKEGIPAFFNTYDPLFNPQDHRLTLDYPALIHPNALVGVDAIHQYLTHLNLEWQFLSAFDSHGVCRLLSRTTRDYQNLFLGNICETVLLTVLGCLLIGEDGASLSLNARQIHDLTEILSPLSQSEIEKNLHHLTEVLCLQVFPRVQDLPPYLFSILPSFAARLHQGVISHSLEGVFYRFNDLG